MGEPPESDVPITDEEGVEALFQGLREPIRIQLWRKKPTWCAGFLVSIDLSPGEMLDLDVIKQDWGGGEIQIRPMINTPSGMKYCKGGRLVKLSGPPRERGMLLQADGSVQVTARALPAPATAAGAARGDGSMIGLLQMLIEQGRERDRQHAELVAELRNGRRGGAPPTSLGLLEQIREFKAIQQELEPGGDDEDEAAPPPQSAQDRLMTLGLMALEKKLGGEASPPRPTKKPAAPPPDAPPSAPGWRLHAAPPAPARAETLPPRGAPPVAKRRVTPEEVFQAFSGLSDEEQMDVAGRVSMNLNPQQVQNWMASNLPGDDQAEDEAAGA